MKAKKLSGVYVVCSPCPLTSALNFPHATTYTRRCVEIIEQSRHIWGYYSDEEKSLCYEYDNRGNEIPKKFPPYSPLKLTAARQIQCWYTERSDLFLTCQKTPEAIKQAVQDVRRYARPGIDNDITDKEILAAFAICEALEAVKKIQRGESCDAVNEKILTARTFLKLAKAGQSTPQDAAKAQNVTTCPLPPGVTASDIKIIFPNDEACRITINGEIKTFNHAQMGFSHKDTGAPSVLWGTLLEYAEGGGTSGNNKERKQKRGERINKILQRFFVTKQDLIKANQPLFNISKKRLQDKKPINIPSKECPSCKEAHKHFCFVCSDEVEHCKDCHDELYAKTHKGLSK